MAGVGVVADPLGAASDEAPPAPQHAPPAQQLMVGNLQCMQEAEREHGAGATVENMVMDTCGTIYDLLCCVCAGIGCSGNMATVNQGSTGVVTKFGKFERTLPPGRHRYNICAEGVFEISLMQECLDVTKQQMMSADNLRLTVDAVTYYQVTDANKAAFSVENYQYGLRNMVQVTLRTVVGEYTLGEVLSERQKISARITQLLAQHMDSWGVQVNRVEMKSIDMDQAMQRALAAKSEATQQAEAKLIQARAQRDSAVILAEAGKTMQDHPAAMKLQWFETMRLISTQGKNTTLVVSDTVDIPKK
jgi:erythrocyte band 7 integral membrane protein